MCSNSLEINGRLEMGQSFLKSSSAASGFLIFFNIGMMAAGTGDHTCMKRCVYDPCKEETESWQGGFD